MKNLLLSCIFVFVLFGPMSSFGGYVSNNPNEFIPRFLSNKPYINTAVTAGFIVGSVAVSYFWTHYNLFGIDASSDKGLDDDANRKLRKQILQEVTKEDGPPKKRDELFKGLKDNEEERLKKMSEKYWRERYGYGLSKDLDKDRKNLENKNPRATENYAYKINSEEVSFSLAKDENSDIYDDGYDGNTQNKKQWFSGGIVRAGSENSGTTETSGTQESGGGSGATKTDGAQESTSVTTEEENVVGAWSIEKLRELYNSKKRNVTLEVELNVEDGSEALRLILSLLRENRLKRFSFTNLTDNEENFNRVVRKLAEILKEENSYLKELHIYESPIFDDGVAELAEMLKTNKTLEIFRLNPVESYNHSNVGYNGLSKLAEALEVNTTLQKFEIFNCVPPSIENMEGWIRFAKAVKRNETLKWLSIRSNRIADCMGDFKPGEPPSEEAEAVRKVVMALREMIKENISLEYLDLSNNSFEIFDATEILCGLRENVGLKELLIVDHENDELFYGLLRRDFRFNLCDLKKVGALLNVPKENIYLRDHIEQHNSFFVIDTHSYGKEFISAISYNLDINSFLAKIFPDKNPDLLRVAKSFLQSNGKFKTLDKTTLTEELKQVFEVFDVANVKDIEGENDRLNKMIDLFWDACKNGEPSKFTRTAAKQIFLSSQALANEYMSFMGNDDSSLADKNGMVESIIRLRKIGLFFHIYAYGSNDHIQLANDDRIVILKCLVENLSESGEVGAGGVEPHDDYLKDDEKKQELIDAFFNVLDKGMHQTDDLPNKNMLSIFAAALLDLFEVEQLRVIVDFKKKEISDNKGLLDNLIENRGDLEDKINDLETGIEDLKKDNIIPKKDAEKRISEHMERQKKLEDKDFVENEEEIATAAKKIADAKKKLDQFVRCSHPSNEEDFKSFVASLKDLKDADNASSGVRRAVLELLELADKIQKQLRCPAEVGKESVGCLGSM